MNYELAQSLNELQKLYRVVDSCVKRIIELKKEHDQLHRPCVEDYLPEAIQSEENFIRKNERYALAGINLSGSGPEYVPLFPKLLFTATILLISGFVADLYKIHFSSTILGLLFYPAFLLSIPVSFFLSAGNVLAFLNYVVHYIPYVLEKKHNQMIAAEGHKKYEQIRKKYERNKSAAIEQFNMDYSSLMNDFEHRQSEIEAAIRDEEIQAKNAISEFNKRATAVGWPYSLSVPSITNNGASYYTYILYPYFAELCSVTNLVWAGQANTINDALYLYRQEKQRQEDIRQKEEERQKIEREKRLQDENERRKNEEYQRLREKVARQDELLKEFGKYILASEERRQREATAEADMERYIHSQLDSMQAEMDRKQKKSAEKQCFNCRMRYSCAHRYDNDGHCTAFVPRDNHYC